MLDSIETLHRNGFIHQDVKVDNFRVKEDGTVIILDFGIMMEYMPNGKHKARGKFGFQGTPNYASINALLGFTLSRRDDLECLAYSIIEILTNKQMNWFQSNSHSEILESKMRFVTDGFKVEPKLVIIREFLMTVQCLKYEEEPDYTSLRELLQNMDGPLIDDIVDQLMQ